MTDYSELIRQIAHERQTSPQVSRWSPDELFDALTKAASLETDALKEIASKVGIRFTDPNADVEQYLMVLDEADDKEKLKRLLSERTA